MIFGDSAFWVAVLIRALLCAAGLVNLGYAFLAYREYRDVRGLRGFVAALAMFGGTVALAGSSQAIRRELPVLEPLFRLFVGAGLTMFIVGLLFAVATWRRRSRP